MSRGIAGKDAKTVNKGESILSVRQRRHMKDGRSKRREKKRKIHWDSSDSSDDDCDPMCGIELFWQCIKLIFLPCPK